MSKEKRRVPKLRFPGFTEDWEQREFSDIFAEVKSGLSRMLSNDDIGLPVVRANNINDGQLNLVDDIKYWYKNDPQGANTNNYLIEQGDILINFINSEAKMGTAAYVTRRPERDTIYTTNILRCKVNDEYNSYFVYSLTFLNSYKNYIASITKPAVNQASFTTVDFKKYSIKIPTVKEQNQIADLIETFNKLITLHQRKLDNLKLKKKALLQKLFPKNGERYPELRFPGFTDAWEQRKADYIFKSVTDKGYPELPVLSASQELGMVYRDQNGIDIQHDKKNETSYKRVLPGQFVIHLRSFQGGFAYSEIEGITSPAYTVMSFKNSSEQYGLFWKHVFKSETFIKRLETITYGIRDGRSISFSDFKSLLLQYPSFSEQKLIGDSIAVIERGITLHQ